MPINKIKGLRIFNFYEPAQKVTYGILFVCHKLHMVSNQKKYLSLKDYHTSLYGIGNPIICLVRCYEKSTCEN